MLFIICKNLYNVAYNSCLYNNYYDLCLDNYIVFAGSLWFANIEAGDDKIGQLYYCML